MGCGSSTAKAPMLPVSTTVPPTHKVDFKSEPRPAQEGRAPGHPVGAGGQGAADAASRPPAGGSSLRAAGGPPEPAAGPEDEESKRRKSVTDLQCAARGFVARRRLAKLRDEFSQAAMRQYDLTHGREGGASLAAHVIKIQRGVRRFQKAKKEGLLQVHIFPIERLPSNVGAHLLGPPTKSQRRVLADLAPPSPEGNQGMDDELLLPPAAQI